MSLHSTYDALRHFADSWGLLVMALTFIVCAAWPFGAKSNHRNRNAKTSIFKDEYDVD